MDSSNVVRIWDKVLEILRKDIAKVSYDTWIKNLIPIGIEQNKLILQVPNGFVKSILEERYEVSIRDAVNEALDNKTRISYIVYSIPEECQWQNKSIGLKPADEMRRISKEANEKDIDINNLVLEQLTKIAKRLELVAERGETEMIYIFNQEPRMNEEIYQLVVQELHDKGYSIESHDKIGSYLTINIKW